MFRLLQLTCFISGFLSLVITIMLLLIRPEPIDWILYTVETDQTVAIYKMRPDGTEQKRLSPQGVTDSNPQWSPDGKWIGFERETADTLSEIYVMDADGAQVQNLSQHQLPDTIPHWSPNGQTVTYLSNRDGYPQIYQVGRDGLQRTNISPDGNTWGEAFWSPKGDAIIFLHWLEGIIRYDVATQQTAKILDTRKTGLIETIQWMPHGRWLIISAENDRTLYRFDPYTYQLEEITPPKLFVRLPQVSPDGHWLAMIAINDEQDTLIITRENGTQVRQLINFPHIAQPQWSPDGNYLVFPAYENGNWDIFRINFDGTGLANLTHSTSNEREVQWSMSILLLDWHATYWVLGSIILTISLAQSMWRHTQNQLA